MPIPLNVLVVAMTGHPLCADFASETHPLRPSKAGQLLKCPMSSFLSVMSEDDGGNSAAHTGNLVHSAAAAYHRATGANAKRKEVGLAALAADLPKFPHGSKEKAETIFGKYADDPENEGADVPWVEQSVTLVLEPAPNDPTGKPVWIVGTLDQVRRAKGRLRVWDIKTGAAKDTGETMDEYLVQQACYTLAAQQTLDPNIEPGGIIYTPGYEKPRGKRFLDLKLTTDRCKMLLAPLVQYVAILRGGTPLFTPSAGACAWCKMRPYTNCFNLFEGAYRR